jgi:hypothetical protein
MYCNRSYTHALRHAAEQELSCALARGRRVMFRHYYHSMVQSVRKGFCDVADSQIKQSAVKLRTVRRLLRCFLLFLTYEPDRKHSLT